MPGVDIGGKLWSVHERVAGHASVESLRNILTVLPDVPVVLDCVYSNHDEEYADVKVLEDMELEIK
jgi:hypothetical protein